MRLPRRGLAIGALLALTLAPTASAAPPSVTVLTIDIVFDVSEDFTAESDVICDEGAAVTDLHGFTGGGRQGRGVFTFHLVKTLTCADGSGTFQILVNAATAPNSPGTVGGFTIVGGTGAYENLRGGGSLLGTATDDGIIDVYRGRLTNRG